jgi:hypothetical protein
VDRVKAWLKKKRGTWIALAAIVLFLAYIALTGGASGIAQGNYSLTEAESFLESKPMQSGALPGTSRVIEGVRWYLAAEYGGWSLWFEPGAGLIAVENETEGQMWFGTPLPSERQKDGSKGLPATHVQSPILLEYLKELDASIHLQSTNTVHQQADVSWTELAQGIGVQYDMAELGFSLYVEYTLNDWGLRVHIPQEGIYEGKGNRLVNFQLLPYFGASLNGPEGFLFVPDGPGGIIRFNKQINPELTAYDQPVYGRDPAARAELSNVNRTPVAFPVFGISRGDQAFVAVIEEGQYKADVIASPAAIQTNFNRAGARFHLRRLYYQPRGLTDYSLNYERHMFVEPITLQYLFLEKGHNGYVEMAKAYRAYLMETKGLTKMEPTEKEPKLYLNVLMAAQEKHPLTSQTLVATSFDQAAEMMKDLVAEGISHLEVGLIGWNNGGLPGLAPNLFPVEKLAGGAAGLKRLASAAEELGVTLRLDQDFTAATGEMGSGFDSNDTARRVSGELLRYSSMNTGIEMFMVSPWYTEHVYVPNALKEIQKFPVHSIGAVNMGSFLFSDFNGAHFYDRRRAAEAYTAAFDQIREQIGNVKVSGANDYVLGHVDHIFGFPAEYNYDMIIDEQVPFYPIALHGLVTYTTVAGNERTQPIEGLLRDIEYGAMPSYMVTYEDPSLLRDTSILNAFSTRYDVNKEQMLREYALYSEANRGVAASFIEDHRKIAEGVYETTYDNGRKIWVNYNQAPYRLDGIEVDALSFRVVAEGGES